jgi:hypothetical protein
VIHLLDAEHLRRRHADTTRLRHDVLLVGEPRHGLPRDPGDHGHVVPKLDAVRFVHPATGEANDPLDLAAADRPHHRVDDRTRRRQHSSTALQSMHTTRTPSSGDRSITPGIRVSAGSGPAV